MYELHTVTPADASRTSRSNAPSDLKRSRGGATVPLGLHDQLQARPPRTLLFACDMIGFEVAPIMNGPTLRQPVRDPEFSSLERGAHTVQNPQTSHSSIGELEAGSDVFEDVRHSRYSDADMG